MNFCLFQNFLQNELKDIVEENRQGEKMKKPKKNILTQRQNVVMLMCFGAFTACSEH